MAEEKIHDSKIMIFTGAGASAALDMPTTAQFIEKLNSRWKNLKSILSIYQEHHKLSQVSTNKKNPIDSEYLRDWLFELKKSGKSIQDLSQFQPINTNIGVITNAVPFVDSLIKDFDLFTRGCYTEIDPNKAFRHYEPLLQWLEQGQFSYVPIFTTNYDLVFESLKDCPECRWHIETGAKQGGTRVSLDFKQYDQLSTNKNTITVYKLHGSTDWWLNQKNGQIIQVPVDNTPPPNCRDLMIYPTRSKFEQIKEKPFAFYYGRLNSYLSSQVTKICIVIGYSFRDQFINEEFAIAIKNGLSLIVIDKNMKKQQLEDEFMRYKLENYIFDNVKIINLGFGDWSLKPPLSEVFKNELTKAIKSLNTNI